MAGHNWETVFLISVCCILCTEGNVYIRVRQTGTSGTFVNTSFSYEKFVKFQECLCNPTVKVCWASYDNNTAPYKITEVVSTGKLDNVDFFIFTCENSNNALKCTRPTDNVTPCSNENGYHFFRVSKSTVCRDTCFGLLWLHPGENFYTPLANVSACDNCCNEKTQSNQITSATPLASTFMCTNGSVISSPTTSASTTVSAKPSSAISSPTISSSTTASAKSSSAIRRNDSDSDNDTLGVIIGVVVGIVFVAIVIVIIFLVLWKRRKLSSRSQTDAHRPPPTISSSCTASNTGNESDNATVVENGAFAPISDDHYASPNLVKSNGVNRNENVRIPPITVNVILGPIPASHDGERNSDISHVITHQLPVSSARDAKNTPSAARGENAIPTDETAYADIDAFSQHKKTTKRANFSRRQGLPEVAVASNNRTSDDFAQNIDELYATVDKGKSTNKKQNVCENCNTVHHYDYACSPESDDLVSGREEGITTASTGDVDSTGTSEKQKRDVSYENVIPEYAVVFKKGRLRDTDV